MWEAGLAVVTIGGVSEEIPFLHRSDFRLLYLGAKTKNCAGSDSGLDEVISTPSSTSEYYDDFDDSVPDVGSEGFDDVDTVDDDF